MNNSVKQIKVEHLDTDDKAELNSDKNEESDSEKYQKHDVYSSQNFVTIDNIRKQIYQREWEIMRKWPERYHFLTGEFLKKMIVEEYSKRKLTKKTSESREADSMYVKLKASPPVPVTSSAFVGWRADTMHDLEFTSTRYISPKYTIEPPLEDGEFRINEQYFIFLN